MLRAQGITAAYGDAQALFGIDFSMSVGEIVALIGANGAGKSTFLKTITGLLPLRSGELEFEGQSLRSLDASDIVKLGIAMVPEGRRLFPSLTVEENLLMGALSGRKGSWNLSRVFQLFPILEEKRNVPSTSLSGGQQQMVAIGRALTAGPSLLILDEPTEGIQPSIIKEIATALINLQKATDCTVLLSEQVLSFAVSVADRLVVLERGAVVHSCGKGAEDVDAVKAFLTI
jgi:branched-chain amino acid transport system ATP-binding protein